MAAKRRKRALAAVLLAGVASMRSQLTKAALNWLGGHLRTLGQIALWLIIVLLFMLAVAAVLVARGTVSRSVVGVTSSLRQRATMMLVVSQLIGSVRSEIRRSVAPRPALI